MAEQDVPRKGMPGDAEHFTATLRIDESAGRR
jgi:hypothetical protein